MTDIAVVIPAYKVRDHLAAVVEGVLPHATHVIVVDDACPERSFEAVPLVEGTTKVHIIQHTANLGVGGAVASGYRKALELGAHIVVKLDGDGQMDPQDIPKLCKKLVSGQADYAKGNRFYNPGSLDQMPVLRLIGNASMSFFSKLSTGYWGIMDPVNGFTAIDARVLRELPLEKIDNRYFFESDMLFRLSTIGAKVADVPMRSRYNGEQSSMSIPHTMMVFPLKYLNRFCKRLGYSYFLRGFNIASLSLVVGLMLMMFGTGFGAYWWANSVETGVAATSGQVMLAALPIFVGLQLLLTFLNYDMSNEPKQAISEFLGDD
ncbi:MAG: glycosyltransferase family 2 protein [Pseudomonadota bacterium]